MKDFLLNVRCHITSSLFLLLLAIYMIVVGWWYPEHVWKVVMNISERIANRIIEINEEKKNE